MPQLLYYLQISSVGKYVANYLQENKLILFAEPVPADIAMYCATHHRGELLAELNPGQVMKINEVVYPITAVGDVATVNLKQLGHITLSFDAAVAPELPGTVHLSGIPPRDIQVGDRISFYDALN